MADGFEEFDAAVNSLKQRLIELGVKPPQAEKAAIEAATSQPATPHRMPRPSRVQPGDETGVTAGEFGLPEIRNPLAGESQPRERMVSVPNYTLGGRRMEGARPMTVQERTMIEDPARQMGRDAGAFASRAANAAGLGIPGIVLDYAAPNALAGIRENEALSNPAMAAMGDVAGSVGAPVNALTSGVVRGGKALVDGFSALPRSVQAAAVLGPAVSASTEAAAPTGGSSAPEFNPPGLGHEIWSAVKEYAPILKKWAQTPSTPDQPMTADEFKGSRRSVAPTFEKILAEEKANIRNDPTYTYGPGQRARLDAKAEADARKRYEASKADVSSQDARLDKDYADYVTGWNKQRDDHYNKQFSERNPGTAMAMTVGGPIASALLTKGIFGKIDKAGSEIAKAGLVARGEENLADFAQNIVRAQNYGPYARVGKAVTVGEAALLPAELRMMQDVIDKKGLPPNAGARKAADERMSDVQKYAGGMGWDVISGLTGAAAGALWNKLATASPKVDLNTLKSYGAGLPRGTSPDDIAPTLAHSIRNTKRAQEKLTGSQGGSPTPSSSGATAPVSIPAETSVPPNQLAGGVGNPAPTSARAPSGPPPLPERQSLPPGSSANQSPSDILKSIRPAPREIPTSFPQSTPDSATKLPPHVKEASNGVYYDERTGHPIPLKFYKSMGLEKPTGTTLPPQKPAPQSTAPEKTSVQIDDLAPMGRRRNPLYGEE